MTKEYPGKRPQTTWEGKRILQYEMDHDVHEEPHDDEDEDDDACDNDADDEHDDEEEDDDYDHGDVPDADKNEDEMMMVMMKIMKRR